MLSDVLAPSWCWALLACKAPQWAAECFGGGGEALCRSEVAGAALVLALCILLHGGCWWLWGRWERCRRGAVKQILRKVCLAGVFKVPTPARVTSCVL